ncbi:MAG: glutamate mutase L [Chloroflexi bacterium]|nr:glutamate mutase L [Chloroflexota bacterium]
MSNAIDSDSLLGVDFGACTTRAALFDVVDGQYRFVGVGNAPTTAAPPYLDVGEGLRHALNQLGEITGRTFLDSDERLIMPGRDDGAGVDALVACASAGPTIRAVLVGLMPGVSLESARRLASSTYISVVEQLGLHDRRPEDKQLDAIIAARPDLIVIAGGTEGGANQAVLKLVETVGLACHLLPENARPQVLYAGNSQIATAVVEKLGGHVKKIAVAPNLRPSLPTENLAPARAELARIFDELRAGQIYGFSALAEWTREPLMPTARAFGQITSFFSRVYDPGKGVLGVDVGASAVTLAAAFEGQLFLSVRPDLGLGENLTGLLQRNAAASIARWLPSSLPEEQVLEYIYNKSLNPTSIPSQADELSIEHALTRELLREALAQARAHWPDRARRGRRRRSGDPGGELLPWFEPILASGAVFAEAPRPGHTALMLLDALQPTGITTLVLDRHGLAPILGAATALNPTATVQVLDSGVFNNLGTVITPVGRARPGSAVLRVAMQYDNGNEVNVEVRAGTLEVLPLPAGQTARLTLQPLSRFDVGLGPGRPATLRRVLGGTVGLIIDARGRPLALPRDPGKRREANQKWLWDVGGS